MEINNNRYKCPYSIQVEDMEGLTFREVKADDNEIQFITDGGKFVMYHSQDCCENVYVESIVGELTDLVGSPILLAEESTSNKNSLNNSEESFTWTFYKFATIKGYVDIRWYGSSNSYYSESVNIKYIPNETKV
jgi:hypothetical protein